jgi:hypothetical protein
MTINDDDDKEEKIPVISDDVELLKRGICCVKIPERIDIDLWAKELSQLTPMILGFEGDGEYSFYRNIMDEPDFPFDRILFEEEEEEQQKEQQSEESPSSSSSVVLQLSDIGKAMIRYFPIITQRQQQQEQEKEKEQHKDKQNRVKYLSEELQLDDAFCVHYNMDQEDTTGKKHIDPSDITINMCLQKSDETEGSYVLFYGTKKLLNVVDDVEENNEEEKEEEVQNNDDDDDDDDDVVNDDDNDNDKKKRINEDNRFYVSQKPGYATIHFGDHTHETTALHHGSRTNIILTYVYTDQNRSDVATRTCY